MNRQLIVSKLMMKSIIYGIYYGANGERSPLAGEEQSKNVYVDRIIASACTCTYNTLINK